MRPLPLYRVRAENIAAEAENKIHDDRVAAAYGFRAGLVPGVTVYGYMTQPIVEIAPEWLERGFMQLRLIEPFYDGESVFVRAEADDDGLIRVTAEREDGTICAKGSAALRVAHSAAPPRLPLCPLPGMEQRQAPSRENVIPGALLGSVTEKADFHGGRPYAERLLQYSNEILARNFRLGPWIHTASELDHWSVARSGEEISARARIYDRFDRKGHEFVVIDVTVVGEGERLIQTVRHTAIYRPRAFISSHQEAS